MNKRIRLYLLAITTLALVVFFVASLFWIRDRFELSARQSLDSYLTSALHLQPEPVAEEEMDSFVRDLARSYAGEVRITVTNSQGQVLGDSEVGHASMPNHLSRKEFADAADYGYGYAVRASETTGIKTIYIVRRWGDAPGYLLRFAIPVEVTRAFIISLLPGLIVLVLLVFALATLFANSVTGRIMAPYDKMFAAIEVALQRKDKEVILEAEYEEMEPVVAYFRTVLSQISDYIDQITAKTEEIEHITGAMEEGLVMLDDGLEIVLINSQASRLLGIPPETWQKNITYLYRDEEFVQTLKNTSRTRKRRVVDVVSEGRILRVYINPVPTGGYVLLISDVTELIQLERVRTDFAANVSHELKTPLTSISGFAELIQAGLVTDGPQVRDYAGKILTESRRLVMLIDDILRLSSIESGLQEAEESVDMRQVMDYTLEVLDTQMREKELEVSVQGTLSLRASRQRMLELAFNLLDNAVKYNRRGGRIAVNLEEDSFWVENTGDLISPEHQSRIFERFYRVDAARSRRTGGTGLGLSITRHIVDQYGGNVAVSSIPDPSTPEKGEAGINRFTVTFPMERVQ